MTRRLCWVLGLALSLACSGGPTPHVLLVTIDTLRRDHCSLYGYPRDTTPNLERLAAEGAVFDAAYAPMSVTGPSVATLLTGRYPLTHGLVRNGLLLSPDEQTLAEILGQRGYATAGLVSSFVLHRKFGFDQGFEHFEDRFEEATASVGPRDTWEGVPVEGAFDRRATATTDLAIRWLESERDPSRPFFLFLHYFDPHSPYRPPTEMALRFRADDAGTADDLDRNVRNYDGEIAYVDAELGRLVAALDRLGVADDTLVIVTADHGEGLGDHGYVFHGAFVYEEEMRVPLLVRWPQRIAPGQRFDAPVELIDLLPTVLELIGGPLPDDRPGRSLARALLGGPPPDPNRPVFVHRREFEAGLFGGTIKVAGQKYGVRQGRWKYIDGPEQGTRELFDLERDPGERENVYYDHLDEARGLAERLASWRLEHTRAGNPAPEVSEQDRKALGALGYER